MKMFELVRANFGFVGIERLQQFKKYHSTSAYLKNCLIFAAFFLWSIFSMVFFLFEAVNFQEYAESLYLTLTIMENMLIYTVLLRKGRNIFKVMDDFESVLENRELIFLKTILIWFFIYTVRIEETLFSFYC